MISRRVQFTCSLLKVQRCGARLYLRRLNRTLAARAIISPARRANAYMSTCAGGELRSKASKIVSSSCTFGASVFFGVFIGEPSRPTKRRGLVYLVPETACYSPPHAAPHSNLIAAGQGRAVIFK